MNKYHIRFNKSRGQEGRGTMDHVWRVFENGDKEYLVKNFKILISVIQLIFKNIRIYVIKLRLLIKL